MSDEYRPRLTLDVSEDKLNELRQLIPWGIRSQIFEVIIEDFIKLLKENNPGVVIGALIQRDISLKDFLNINIKE